MDLDVLFADLTEAVQEATPQLAVRDVLQRAIERPSELAAALPCTRAEFSPLLNTPTLTVMKTVWAPGMVVPPHDHRTWGVIAVFAGKERNTYYRRQDGGLAQVGGKELEVGDISLMGTELIHSVSSPLERTWTGAIHVYGGDFVAKERSMWIDGEERLNDSSATAAIFEEANRTLTKW